MNKSPIANKTNVNAPRKLGLAARKTKSGYAVKILSPFKANRIKK